MTEDEMVGSHHLLKGHEFEQIPGDGEGQGSLARCSPWGRKESDTTEGLNNSPVLPLHPPKPTWHVATTPALASDLSGLTARARPALACVHPAL